MLHGLTPSFPTRRSSDLRTGRRFSIAAVRGGTRLAARQSTGEACALARFGVELDPAAMQLDQAFREGEAEPRPRFARMRIAALEFLEDARAILRHDADAGVADDEVQLVAELLGRAGNSGVWGKGVAGGGE